ncbi:MAG: hypothetical protein ACLGHN_07380 [Bacteriovoracia bacterium]
MKSLFLLSLLLLAVHSFANDWREQIIKDAKTIYTPVSIIAFNKPIYFKTNESQSVGASADHREDHLAVIIDKGLLESKRLTPDGLRMVICHELGHLFGGAPRRNVPMEWDGPVAPDGMSFMTSEGQADYYASLVCFRKMLEIESPGSSRPDFSRVGPRLRRKCQEEAGHEGQELTSCLRAGLAGEDFLKLVFEFPISCEKFDDSIAPVLIRDVYPGRQCRLDTILSGALCSENQPMVQDFDLNEKNSCGQNYAERPRCWYR